MATAKHPCFLRCPECGDKTKIKKTIPHGTYIRRRHVCVSCGNRETSIQRFHGKKSKGYSDIPSENEIGFAIPHSGGLGELSSDIARLPRVVGVELCDIELTEGGDMGTMIRDSKVTVSQSPAAKLEGFWTRAGFPRSKYPCSTTTVLRLLTKADYRLCPKSLTELISSGVVSPPMRSGQAVWGPGDILALIGACEVRRMWRWPSRIHWPKLTQAERVMSEAGMVGQDAFADLPNWPTKDLLLLSEQSEHRHVRNAVRLVLSNRLGSSEA